ncbi:MAG: ShlB/FhaC/HecB family hemolysin secretion/activation protein, partial [Cyclobacteriaceae bacterium]
IKVLKARRDDMMRYAREHYLFLSKEVVLTGSDKDELFEVNRLNDDSTSVSVYKLGKDGDKQQLIYNRIFLTSETEEIRLYGLSGRDQYRLEGKVKEGIKVIVLGGRKKDLVYDNSSVSGWSKKTVVYDKSVEVNESSETRVVLADDNEEYEYNRKSFKYDVLMPQLSFQINPDDGLFLGAGFIYTKNNWRKKRYAARHDFLVNAAFATGSYSIDYNGSFTEVLGDWGVELEAINQTPYFVNNFFGLGNDTSFDFEGEGDASGFDNPIQFYRIRTDRNHYSASLFRNFGTQSKFSFGPLLRTATVDDDDNNFLLTPESNINTEKVSRPHSYLGGQFNILLDSRDNQVLTLSGTKLEFGARHLRGLNERSENFTVITGNFSMFFTPRATNFTFATRTGFQHVIGEFEFFNAATLGGRTNLRGFRRTRFYGETAFYNNIDLRLKLFSFRSYLFPAKVGIMAFHDVGRVWIDSEESDTWHRSIGFGLWMAPANAVIISLNYGITEEENLPSVTFGFLF